MFLIQLFLQLMYMWVFTVLHNHEEKITPGSLKIKPKGKASKLLKLYILFF